MYTYCGHFKYTRTLCQHWDKTVALTPDDVLVVVLKLPVGNSKTKKTPDNVLVVVLELQVGTSLGVNATVSVNTYMHNAFMRCHSCKITDSMRCNADSPIEGQ